MSQLIWLVGVQIPAFSATILDLGLMPTEAKKKKAALKRIVFYFSASYCCKGCILVGRSKVLHM